MKTDKIVKKKVKRCEYYEKNVHKSFSVPYNRNPKKKMTDSDYISTMYLQHQKKKNNNQALLTVGTPSLKEAIKTERPVIPQVNNEEGISICLSAWNTQDYIEECLDSIAAQTWFKTHGNWEILLGIDACEKTLAKVKEIMHKYKNLSVYMMDENVGTYVTCNTIMKLAKYEWLLRFDTDDVMYPNMVETMMKEKSDAKLILPYCNVFPSQLTKEFLGEGQMMIFSSTFFEYGGFIDWKCGADTELRIRLKNKIKIKNIQKALFKRRKHEDSLTKKNETNFSSKYRKERKEYITTTSSKTPKIDFVTSICRPIKTEEINNTYKYKEYSGEKAIISLTSWKSRINTVYITIESLIQNCPNFHIVVVLSSDEFPQKEKELPINLLKYLYENKIEILWIKKNYKAFKKVIFTSQKYPNTPIISADDDCRYICNYAEELYEKWLEKPNDIIRYNMYNLKDDWQYTQGPSTLYPPKYFPIIFTPIIKNLENGIITDYMNDDTILTNYIKKNNIHISHIYRGHHFCFKFHNESGALHNNRKNKDFETCYD